MRSKDFVRGFVAVAVVTGSLSLAERAIAADYDYGGSSPEFIPAPYQDKVEFASNWYVRGDLAYAAETFPKIASGSTTDPSIAPAFAFGPSSSVLNSFSVGAGLGYKVNNWFRTDLVLDYRSPIQAAGIGNPTTCAIVLNDPLTGNPTQLFDTCVGHFSTQIHRWDLLANGYIDFGTWGGFTPYIGAGAGVTWARIHQSVNWSLVNGMPCQANCGFTTDGNNFYYTDYDRSQGQMTYQFAWALMAGVAIAMTEQAQLDVGYRFLDLGNVTGISGVTGTPASQRVFVNELRAGVRYMID